MVVKLEWHRKLHHSRRSASQRCGPRGVFNLVNGDGATVGQRIAAHPTSIWCPLLALRAGVLVAKAAADWPARAPELGQIGPHPFRRRHQVLAAGGHPGGGQSCQAPTRMLVHRSQQERAFASAKAAAGAVKVGDPRDPQTTMGPVVNEAQFKNVQRLIGSGIEAGATLVTGGLGCPDGLSRGY